MRRSTAARRFKGRTFAERDRARDDERRRLANARPVEPPPACAGSGRPLTDDGACPVCKHTIVDHGPNPHRRTPHHPQARS